MRAENFDVHKITEGLQGTCTETIQSMLDYHYPGMSEDDLTQSDYADIDNEVFTCTTCGWWCEMSENHDQDGEWVCDDCYEGGEDD